MFSRCTTRGAQRMTACLTPYLIRMLNARSLPAIRFITFRASSLIRPRKDRFIMSVVATTQCRRRASAHPEWARMQRPSRASSHRSALNSSVEASRTRPLSSSQGTRVRPSCNQEMLAALKTRSRSLVAKLECSQACDQLQDLPSTAKSVATRTIIRATSHRRSYRAPRGACTITGDLRV